ncbi:MAG: class I SAM-dependent methyltransferase [Porticoccaceae bacterium]|nr:class I SAM-dependent methyltransferase [Porticoccaceae bacterium]
MSNIIVSYSDNSFKQAAELVSEEIDIPIVQLSASDLKCCSEFDYIINLSSNGLSFLSPTNNHGAIRCDFVSGSHRHRRSHGGGNGQMIAKAVGVSGKFYPRILDLTAGLGSDGFVLASLGCSVNLLERNPIVHLLLKDGLDRARHEAAADKELAAIIQRMNLIEINSSVFLDSIDTNDYPDVIYIDPMFPPRKKSAQVKKEMQALHRIVGGDEDASILLEKALNKAIYRVVVKRPAHSKYLGDLKPSYSLEGKSTRYDIFAKQKIPK